MRNTKSAFTLVELIVVITILAILGTIAFISLQGYSADARNSKRTSDLGNIQSAISLKQVEGVPLMSFVTGVANEVTDIQLGWAAAWSVAADDYNAGNPAYTVLNVVEKDFKDPQNKEYVIGATVLGGGVFQVSATIEVDGTDEALVNGTFNSRDTTTYNIESTDQNTVTLVDSAANRFKKDDLITLSVGWARKVTKVSRDGVNLTVDGAVLTWTGTAQLVVAEDTGLIGDKTDKNVPVVNWESTALAY